MKTLYAGWIQQAWRKEDADQNIISLQRYFIGILFLLCISISIGWMTCPSRLTVYIPPDIQNGATMKAGSIPSPLIYSFAYEIWQELNYWPQNGDQDYRKNITGYWSYLTPAFKSELMNEADELKKSGQAERIRYIHGVSGAAYEASNVRRVGNDTWEVNLKMRLTEYKNNQPVKDVEIIYPLKVTRVNVSHRDNPYGLAIAGFASEPKRLITYI